MTDLGKLYLTLIASLTLVINLFWIWIVKISWVKKIARLCLGTFYKW